MRFIPCKIIGLAIYGDLEIVADAKIESPSDLEDENDDLRNKLVFLHGRLKHTFNHTKIIDPLLTDTALAKQRINQRLRRQVERMTTRLEDLNKQTTPLPALLRIHQ